MNKPVDVRAGGGNWRGAAEHFAMHRWTMPASAVLSAVAAAVLAAQVLGWKLDLKSFPALPEIPPQEVPAATPPVRVSSAGFVPTAATPPAEKPASPASPSKSALPVELLGTFVGSRGGRPVQAKSIAIVQLTTGTKEVNVLKIGGKWQGMELLEVERSRIWVRNLSTGAKEYVSNDQLMAPTIHAASKSAPPTDPGQIVVSRAQVNRAISNNTNNILSWVEIPPYAVSGSIEGFQLKNMKPRGKPFFNLLGFQEGDVIKRVNGVKMDSVDKAVGLWQALHGKDEVSFSIERQGIQKELSIVFKP